MNRILFVMIGMTFFVVSCDNTEEYSFSDERQALSLTINPQQWGNTTTRASYNAFSEGSSGNKTFSMSFQTGDEIGLFAVDKNGKVVIANKRYTYSGSTWQTSEPIEFVNGLSQYTFFAYYPYQINLSGAPAEDSTPDITTADTFFENAVTAWTPAADQSTIEKFTGQDLMIAKGTNSVPLFHEVNVTFTMIHQMGLLVTKGTLSYYDINDPTDTWTVEQTFSPNRPYAISDKYYFFVKPGVATTLGTKTATVDKGQLEQLYYTNGEPSTH